MEKLLKVIIALLAVMLVLLFTQGIGGGDNSPLGASMSNEFYYGDVSATSTTLSLTAGDLDDVVLESNFGRRYAEITNTGGTIAYLAYIADTATTSALISAVGINDFTIPLTANGGTYRIDFDNLYKGRILATSTAGVTIRAIEVD